MWNIEVIAQRKSNKTCCLFQCSVHVFQAVWFGCDVGKCFYRQPGLLDLNV